MTDVAELERSQALGFSGSVTSPADRVKVTKPTLDSSNSKLGVAHCARVGVARQGEAC